ncbi:MAG: hypothetical protein SAqBPW_37920 [Shewanella algae]
MGRVKKLPTCKHGKPRPEASDYEKSSLIQNIYDLANKMTGKAIVLFANALQPSDKNPQA